jgi:hypothetical protein
MEAVRASDYPAHARALEQSLESFRNRLLADLTRAESLATRAVVRDNIRDVARLVRWGILPVAAHLSKGADCPEVFSRVSHVLSELERYAHPDAGLPPMVGSLQCASCPLLNEIPRKLELLAAGIGRLTITKGGRNGN